MKYWFVCVERQAPQKNGWHVMNNIISFRVILCGGGSPPNPLAPIMSHIFIVQGMAYIVDRYITDIIKTL